MSRVPGDGDNRYPKGEMPEPMPDPRHMSYRTDGVIGDSADKRFTYVRGSEPDTMYEIDWKEMEHLLKPGGRWWQ